MKLTELGPNVGIGLHFEAREMLGSAPFMANLLCKVELGHKHQTSLFFTEYEIGALLLVLQQHLREVDRVAKIADTGIPEKKAR